jgi:sodium/potassium-transporting ATPase subunit alpha
LEKTEQLEQWCMAQISDSKLQLLGLIGIVDPPRAEIPGSIGAMRSAGIRVFMVTGKSKLIQVIPVLRQAQGDFKLTAESIARQVGIITVPHVENLDDVKRKSKLPLVRPEFGEINKDGLVALTLTGNDLNELADEDWNFIVHSYSEIVFARVS